MLKEKERSGQEKRNLEKITLEMSPIRKANEEVKQSEVTVCERSDELNNSVDENIKKLKRTSI